LTINGFPFSFDISNIVFLRSFTDYMERTLVLLKPDTVRRKLAGELIQRFERRNFRLVGMKLTHWDLPTAENFYSIHKGKPFYEELIQFMTSGPIVALCLEGDNAIAQVRKMMGTTNTLEALPGTIRGDYTLSTQQNMVHGSDSQESFDRECPIVFRPEELLS
jgi:nucleoside-diphosphate kinase